MIGVTYPFLSEEYIAETDTLFYVFLSQSEELIIPKAIAFTPIEKIGEKYYNWGFGDMILDPGSGQYHIDDKAETNNGDTKTVFYTVVSTLITFFQIHPDAIVHIEGSNEQRMRVYRNLIIRHWKQIEPVYKVEGYIEGSIEAFQPNRKYEFVLISQK